MGGRSMIVAVGRRLPRLRRRRCFFNQTKLQTPEAGIAVGPHAARRRRDLKFIPGVIESRRRYVLPSRGRRGPTAIAIAPCPCVESRGAEPSNESGRRLSRPVRARSVYLGTFVFVKRLDINNSASAIVLNNKQAPRWERERCSTSISRRVRLYCVVPSSLCQNGLQLTNPRFRPQAGPKGEEAEG
ncbi:hypothetical protein THAOC_35705 [Thalassiosira oceanica]|uniref:Uncharacterized protein n=1 Tax=Thalassiosira oceanica TaxID=159749 RepID=K0R1C1_THAOC|nr:hypothetical protein THAOC_35705 [Thalassiosira oceanica]|eukprot:EJK45675.1 hypothetical protein THAOC_35705 [Thalassiosira oceanica]